MSRTFNGVLPVPERCADKELYMSEYLKRKRGCREFYKQAKAEFGKYLDDGRMMSIVKGQVNSGNKHGGGDGLYVGIIANMETGDDFYDFLD